MKSPPKLLLRRRKSFDAKVQSFLAMRKLCSTIEFQNDRRQSTIDEGQSFDILKTMIFHGGRIAIHLTCEICRPKCILLIFFTIFKRKRGGVSIFHFALYYAVFLLDQVLIIKITTQESGLFFLFFITSSIYRFSQKKRIGLIIENKR